MAIADKVQIKATLAGDVALVRCILKHTMETGLRKDPKTGQLIPPHHITEVVATLGGKTVLNAQWSGALAKNPYLAFKVKGAKAGDKVTVAWVDNKGQKDGGEAVIG